MRNRKREEKIGNGREQKSEGEELKSDGKAGWRDELLWRRELQREAGEKISRAGISVGEGEHRLE